MAQASQISMIVIDPLRLIAFSTAMPRLSDRIGMPLSISFHAPEGGHRFQKFESQKAERHRYTQSADRGPSADEIGEGGDRDADRAAQEIGDHVDRSEEHTSELQSLMRISYAVFCLKKKNEHRYIKYHR